MSLTLPAPVLSGSEICVKTTNPALDVTDNCQNQYLRLSMDEWRTIADRSGPLTVTVDWATGEGNEMQVQEWR
jgi:hypothetical protein